MPVIEVSKPFKSDTKYIFEYTFLPDPLSPGEATKFENARASGDPFAKTAIQRFGFTSVNYKIRHHDLWDSIYPLMFLTRNGGPLYGAYDRATIRFDYPISPKVRDFYVRRASSFGIAIKVEANETTAVFDGLVGGHIVAFGGGKDSRLLLGILRETGVNPLPVVAGATYAADLPEAHITQGVTFKLVDRIIPALMSAGEHFYFGACLADCARQTPWQQHFDMANSHALADFENLLVSLGLPMGIHAPTAMLPSNVVQHVLCERYPQLYAHQYSVKNEAKKDKNLHVALCELHHGISFKHHCSDVLFKELALKLIERSHSRPNESGYRNQRNAVDVEMRAILARHRDHPLLASFATLIPDSWQRDWIDCIHPEAAPDAPPEFLRIFSLYASILDSEANQAHDSPFIF